MGDTLTQVEQIATEHGWPVWRGRDVVLVNCDCLEMLPLLPDASLPAIWTDPPYGHGNQDDDLQAARVRDDVRGARKKKAEPIACDSPDEMRRVVDAALLHAARILSPDCCCCCCCGGGGPKPTFAWTADRMDRQGLEFFHAVVWDKSDRGNGMGWRFRRNYEFIMVAHRRNGRLLWADNSVAVPNIIRRAPPRERIHPNEKPVKLITDFLTWTTSRGHVILDPFLGSGTTAVACQRTGRRCIGLEISRDYWEIAVRRCQAEENRHPLFEQPKPKQAVLDLQG